MEHIVRGKVMDYQQILSFSNNLARQALVVPVTKCKSNDKNDKRNY